MKKSKGFKKTIGRLLPFVKKYKFSFIIAIICIISATMNALAPKTEGLIITQLTKDVISIAKGVPGASVNFDYVTKYW